MPIYEYECGACGHRLEAFQKISENALTDCPECHKPLLQKLISATSFQLKGTGWYATDFKDKSKSETKAPDTKPASDTTSTEKKSSSGTSEAKTTTETTVAST